MSNYVQKLKDKISEAIYDCESLDEYLELCRKQGDTVEITEVKRRVVVIRKTLEAKN